MSTTIPAAADFLEALVRIRSHSREEADAVAWLVERMAELGYDEAYADEAGNAVGVLGNGPRTLVMLGHIDTVTGDVPVRREDGKLYGRGTVDAKGPLASFVLAAASIGARPGWRIAVIGAVEEESATSKGARHVAKAWSRPEACIIGEPSSWRKVCLGYKGRLLVDYRLRRAMTHTAGEERGACEHAVDFWNAMVAHAERYNRDKDRAFDQVTPSIRTMRSSSDGLHEVAELFLGVRIPTGMTVARLRSDYESLADPQAELAFSSEEEAIKSGKNNPLVRAFLAAIREEDGKPGFSVKTGTADMNVVGPRWQCPILAYGPGDSTLDHTPDEHIEIEELDRAVRVLQHVLRSMTTLVVVIAALVFASFSAHGSEQTANPSPPAEDTALASDPRLWIVAPQSLHQALQSFAIAKSERLPTNLVILEKLLAKQEGADDAEKLKRALYEAYRDDAVGLRYVLLVGDAGLLPVRYMTLDRIDSRAYDTAFYPSDLYYADVAETDGSFDDWNAEKEGHHEHYFGEVRGEKNKKGRIDFDRVSYVPELAVGRWPVRKPSEVQILVRKTLAYERGVKRAHAAFAFVGGWIDARPHLSRFAGALPKGWKTTKLYDGTETPPTERRVVALLDEGVGLLVHAGHGQDSRWEGSLTTGSIARLQNHDRLPIILSAGCSTARFATLPPYEPYIDIYGTKHAGTNEGEQFSEPPPPPAVYQTGSCDRTGLGEQLLRQGPGGAVAYFGCNTGSQPSAMTLIEGFADSIRTSRGAPLRLGDAWIGAVRYYVDEQRIRSLTPTASWYPPSIFFQGMKFMLFGDPTIELPNPSVAPASD